MSDREKYRQKFASYPDLVNLIQFREMLGGIADSTARKLMRENRVKHYYIRTTYLIPKEWVIDYLLSTHYAKYRQKLKVHVWDNPTVINKIPMPSDHNILIQRLNYSRKLV